GHVADEGPEELPADAGGGPFDHCAEGVQVVGHHGGARRLPHARRCRGRLPSQRPGGVPIRGHEAPPGPGTADGNLPGPEMGLPLGACFRFALPKDWRVFYPNLSQMNARPVVGFDRKTRCYPFAEPSATISAAQIPSRPRLTVAYQVQCRLSDVAPVRARGFDHTTQGSFAVAAGVSRVLGLDQGRAVNAIAIGGTAFNAL